MKKLGLIIIFLSAQAFAQTTELVEFKKGQLEISGKTLNVEIADQPQQHQRGLMYRTELAEDSGMLFIFIGESKRSFWMKNTFVDLSIGFFDKNRKLLQVMDMAAVKSEMEAKPPHYESLNPARYALEVKKGWFKRNKVKLGATFKLFKNRQ